MATACPAVRRSMSRRNQGENSDSVGKWMQLASDNQAAHQQKVLVDITRISTLDTVAVRDGALEVGATVTQEALARWPELEATQPLLARALPLVGHYQTRQRGTVCGSVAHSDPSAELPLVLAVLDGEVVLRSRRRTRTVAARDFQVGMLATATQPDEMIVACRFPVAADSSACAFREITQRHGDFAMVALAAVATGEGVRLGVGGVAPVPACVRIPSSSDEDSVREILEDLAWRLGATDDQHATARYRRELVRRLGARMVSEVTRAIA